MVKSSVGYDRFVISEMFPISVVDMDNGESYPLADGIGFVEEMCKLLNEFNEEIFELKQILSENTDVENILILNNRKRWVDDIKKYINECDDWNIIQFCLSYTLQSLKNGEDMDRFKWI